MFIIRKSERKLGTLEIYNDISIPRILGGNKEKMFIRKRFLINYFFFTRKL